MWDKLKQWAVTGALVAAAGAIGALIARRDQAAPNSTVSTDDPSQRPDANEPDLSRAEEGPSSQDEAGAVHPSDNGSIEGARRKWGFAGQVMAVSAILLSATVAIAFIRPDVIPFHLPDWILLIALEVGTFAVAGFVVAVARAWRWSTIEIAHALTLAKEDQVIEVRLKAVELKHDWWRTVLQTGGAVIVLAGAVTAWQSLQSDRSGQITDRYSRAVEQLGSDSADIRIGGVYALERLAHDSQVYRSSVAGVLTAFVRRHAPLTGPNVDSNVPSPSESPSRSEIPGPSEATERSEVSDIEDRVRAVFPPRLEERSPEVAAAIAVLGRMHPAGVFIPDEHTPLNLTSTNLPYATLDDANLSGSILHFSDLTGAHLSGVDLSDASGANIKLVGARLWDANLSMSFFGRADLTSAGLSGANLSSAEFLFSNFTGASLRDANLTDANLAGSDLSDADFTGANLKNVYLEGACSRGGTKWPRGFDSKDAGVEGSSAPPCSDLSELIPGDP